MDVFHLSRLIPIQAKKFGDKAALRYRDYTDGSWKSVSWNEFNRNVDRTAKAMINFSIFEKDRIGLFSQNKP
ncbi:MAG TPA: long-chain fatty acid--CoA ligase, partial [Bacteroidales bacterium]